MALKQAKTVEEARKAVEPYVKAHERTENGFGRSSRIHDAMRDKRLRCCGDTARRKQVWSTKNARHDTKFRATQRKGHLRVSTETTGSVFGEWPSAVRHMPVK
jgi:hypothetical protein